MWRFLFLVIVLGAAAAFFTNPSEEKAKALLGEMIMTGINTQDISPEKSAAGNTLLIACKLRPSDCLKVLNTQLTTQYEDFSLMSTLTAEGLGYKAWCVGAFTRLTCPGGLKAD